MKRYGNRLFFKVLMFTAGVLVGTPVSVRAADIQAVDMVPAQEAIEESGREMEGAAAGSLGETDHSEEGQIQKPAYLEEQKGKVSQEDPTDNTYGYYTIMGETTVTAEEMAAHFQKQNLEYPSEALKAGGAETIEQLCEIIVEEAGLENVRGEIVFEQAMLETGWLQFQGVCKPEQFNFAGLGATGGDVEGIHFPDVRTGIRAQVQHLKAYASSEELVNECVDERFELVQRETAPYVEWLGIQENPYGGGWAAGENYGYKLRSLLGELTGEPYVSPAPVPTNTPETFGMAGQDTDQQAGEEPKDSQTQQNEVQK